MPKLIDAIDRALAAPPVAPALLGDGIVCSPAFLRQVRDLLAAKARRRQRVGG